MRDYDLRGREEEAGPCSMTEWVRAERGAQLHASGPSRDMADVDDSILASDTREHLP